jgi:hypothetical protein
MNRPPRSAAPAAYVVQVCSGGRPVRRATLEQATYLVDVERRGNWYGEGPRRHVELTAETIAEAVRTFKPKEAYALHGGNAVRHSRGDGRHNYAKDQKIGNTVEFPNL